MYLSIVLRYMGCDGLLFFFLERFSTLSHETRITFTVLLWLKNTKRLFSLFFFFQGEGSLYANAPFTITFSLLPFYLFQYCVMYSLIDSNINGLHCFFFFCMCVLPSIITSVFIGGVLRCICVYLYMFHRKAKSSSSFYGLFFSV